MPVAGKTGTTSSYKDIWFTGYTPFYTCSVWGGYDNNASLQDEERSYNKTLWSAIMTGFTKPFPIRIFPGRRGSSPSLCAARRTCPLWRTAAPKPIKKCLPKERFRKRNAPSMSQSLRQKNSDLPGYPGRTADGKRVREGGGIPGRRRISGGDFF